MLAITSAVMDVSDTSMSAKILSSVLSEKHPTYSYITISSSSPLLPPFEVVVLATEEETGTGADPDPSVYV